jgi:protein-disulfide isomerase
MKQSLLCVLVVMVFASFAWRFWRIDQKLAEVDGIAISRAEVEKIAGKNFFNLREQLYRLERQKTEELINATLLTREARKRGISVATLLDQEVNTKILPGGEDEIEAFYKVNKERLPVELNKVHDQIRDFLREKKIEAQKALFFKSLRSKSKIVTYLKQPPVFRAEISVNGAPFKGPEGAPVTIIKFEDFQCPYCKQVQPTFVELFKQYDGKVRLVHKDFPLEAIHPLARQTAEAARCANEQGKFWSYHDKLYASAPKLSAEDLKNYAKEVGLNVGLFDRCFSTGKYRAIVEKDLSDGVQLGVTATPIFFINGREISGAQPLETFVTMIEEELGQAK